jgi:hypothetical protein
MTSFCWRETYERRKIGICPSHFDHFIHGTSGAWVVILLSSRRRANCPRKSRTSCVTTSERMIYGWQRLRLVSWHPYSCLLLVIPSKQKVTFDAGSGDSDSCLIMTHVYAFYFRFVRRRCVVLLLVVDSTTSFTKASQAARFFGTTPDADEVDISISSAFLFSL